MNLYERAIRLLSTYMPPENTKPVLLLSIRVGIYLLENKYSEDIVLAGFLHDILEDTNIAPVEIQNIFGKNVLELITANTKNTSIVDKTERRKELIKRCVKLGQDSAIIKAADILDNYQYYKGIGDATGIEYCQSNASLVKKYMLTTFNDPIFETLNSIY